MRTVEIKGRKIEIRPLTRAEIRSLKDCGYSFLGCIPDMKTANDAQERAMGLVLGKDDIAFLDDCPNRDATEVWKEILKETYGDPEEEKNS